MTDLSNQEYLRERLQPRPGDFLYLSLSDLSLAVRSLIPSEVRKVLDYGSGGSPYRSLFGDCVYHRADLTGDNLDFQYGSDSRLPSEAMDYDFILSSQVLEHVEDPVKYLQECYRVLKPNGRLLLTTHGMFEDHACPYDYWRWTTFGLQKIVEDAGFKVEANKKITTGPRAAVFLAERCFEQMHSQAEGLYAKLLWRGIQFVRKRKRRLHIVADRRFQRNRVVDASELGHDIYIGIAIRAARN